MNLLYTKYSKDISKYCLSYGNKKEDHYLHAFYYYINYRNITYQGSSINDFCGEVLFRIEKDE